MHTTTRNSRLLEMFAEKADLPVSELDPEQTLEEIGLDSLHLMELALWVQKEYGAEIADGELRDDRTLADTLAYLTSRIG